MFTLMVFAGGLSADFLMVIKEPKSNKSEKNKSSGNLTSTDINSKEIREERQAVAINSSWWITS